MERNVGGFDRWMRLLVGGVLVIIALAGYVEAVTLSYGPISQPIGALIVFVVGGYILATSVTQRCSINEALDINTYQPRSRP